MVGLEFWAKEYLKAEGAFICCRIQYYILTYFRFIIIGVIASFEKAYENLQLGVSSILLVPS